MDYVFKMSVFKITSIVLYSVHWYMHYVVVECADPQPPDLRERYRWR